nr:hypothetical protein [uncultured Desulfobulbus sp.]
MKQSTLSKISAQLVEKLAQLARQARALAGASLSVFPNHIFTSNAQGEQTAQASDQRQHPRVALRNTTVHVTDGCLFATALLENISPSGLCICNLPEQLYKNAGKLTVFSSDDPGLPVLQIEPRWQRTNWRGKTIGAVILNATDAWRLFFVHTAGQFT